MEIATDPSNRHVTLAEQDHKLVCLTPFPHLSHSPDPTKMNYMCLTKEVMRNMTVKSNEA